MSPLKWKHLQFICWEFIEGRHFFTAWFELVIWEAGYTDMDEIGSKCCIVCVFLNKFIFIYHGSDPHDFLVNKQKGKVPEIS